MAREAASVYSHLYQDNSRSIGIEIAGGLVRITLKRAYADGTVAVDMDPLSLLCRLAASVPPPRFHTVK